MKRILGVAAIALFTGGIVLAPTDREDPQPEAAPAPEVTKAAKPVFLDRLGFAAVRRTAPIGPSDQEAIQIAMKRGAELRAKPKSAAPLVQAALETPPTTEAPAIATSDSLWEVTGTRVNLRAGPGTGHAVVGQAALGEKMTPAGDTSGDWIQVRRANGQDAWIFSRFLARSDG